MGCFGYICKGCGTPINGDCFSGGEKCVLIHVRHGEEIGRVEGHYDEYGRVAEQAALPEAERYRGDSDGPNGHSEICKSEFELDDSYECLRGSRIYKAREQTYHRYIVLRSWELGTDLGGSSPTKRFEREFAGLPIPVREKYSGTVAWHSLCYACASESERRDLTPSRTDPNQSWGNIRKKYE
jgi:hypothetical protein